MLHVTRIMALLLVLFNLNLSAFSSDGDICAHKGKIHSIIIGGIRAPGHWLYPQVDKVYGKEDKHVLIINDLFMTNPDVQAQVNNASLPLLKKKLVCLKGSVHQILFEHVGYGLQEKHFNQVMPFLFLLLKPGGKIIYTSYRVPFSYSYAQERQRKEYLPIVPDFCQLLGIPEPKTIYEFFPHQITHEGYGLQSELTSLNNQLHQKITVLLENDSCYDVENDPEVLELMKRAKTIINHPSFPSPTKPWFPIESYLLLHDNILNCNSDLRHEIASCDITKKWRSFQNNKSPCSQTIRLFEKAGFIVQSVEVERTDDVFAFKIIVQKLNSQAQLP